MAGHVLHQGAAAVDVEAGFPHPPQEAGDGEGVDGVDPVGEAGVVRVAGEHPDGQIRVDLPQLGDNGLQDGVVAGVAPAVGAAHQGPVPAAPEVFLPLLAAEDGAVDGQLPLQGALQGEVGLGPLVEPLPQVLPQGGILGQGDQAAGQPLRVPRLEEQAVDAVLDEVGHAAHPAGYRGQGCPGPLGEGVGEGLGQGGEGVDVDGVVEAVGVGDPPGKAHLPLHPQLGGELFQHVHLLPVAGDEQPQLGAGLVGDGEAPHQGGDVLHRVEPGGDAHHHAVPAGLQPHGAEVRLPGQGGGAGGEVQAVVDGEQPVRVKAPGDEQVGHGVGHADAVVQQPQGDGVDGAVAEAGEGAAQVVQTVVGVDGGDHRQPGGPAQQGPHHIAPGPVAVDDLIALLPDHPLEGAVGAQQVAPGEHHGADPQLPGLLGEGALHEAHHGHVNGAGEVLEQGVDMGLGSAAVPAGDQMDDFHRKTSRERKDLFPGMDVWYNIQVSVKIIVPTLQTIYNLGGCKR